MQAEIGLEEGGPNNHIALRVAKRITSERNRSAGDSGASGLQQITSQSSRRLYAIRSGSGRISYDVRAVRVEIGDIGVRACGVVIGEIGRQTTVHIVDDGNLPSPQERIHRPW